MWLSLVLMLKSLYWQDKWPSVDFAVFGRRTSTDRTGFVHNRRKEASGMAFILPLKVVIRSGQNEDSI